MDILRSSGAPLIVLSVLLGFALASLLGLGARVTWAETPAAGLKECFATRTWMINGNEVNAGRLPRKTLKIPAGWTPISGGTSTFANEGVVILCR